MSTSSDAPRQATTATAVSIDARLDVLPRTGLSFGGATALLLCYFFANYDISVFAVVAPSLLTAFSASPTDLAAPVTWNLVGYCVGAYAFGHIADKHGRVRGLVLTIGVLSLGGFLSAFAWDMASFTGARFIAGCGMGAVLALASTYIGEMAPPSQRGSYLAKLYTVQAMLIAVVSMLSLPVLTALPEDGWRWLVGFGGLVFIAFFFLNDRHMHESPRWLALHGRLDRADRLTRQMERRAGVPEGGAANPEAVTLDATEPAALAPTQQEKSFPTRTLLARPYFGRLAMILTFWFVWYMASYGFLSYTPLLLEGLGISATNALFVTTFSRIAGVAVPLVMMFLIERIERRTLIVIGCAMMAVALLLLLAFSSTASATAAVALMNLGIGWVVMPAYIYTSELFPTRARGTASAIADGAGHLGGAVVPWIFLPILANHGAEPAIWTLLACLVVSALVVRTGTRTRNRALTEIAA